VLHSIHSILVRRVIYKTWRLCLILKLIMHFITQNLPITVELD